MAFDDVDPYYKSELMIGDGLPENQDWENVRRFCLFLQKFYELTVKVSGSSYITSNTFFMIFALFMLLCIIGKKNLMLS